MNLAVMNHDYVWSRESVRERFYEMGETFRALSVPGCWPAGYHSSWPDYVRDIWHEMRAAYEPETGKSRESRVRPGPPSGRDIDRMDEAISWIGILTAVGSRKLMWMRALRIPVPKIADLMGCSTRSVEGWHYQALDLMAEQLNKRGIRP